MPAVVPPYITYDEVVKTNEAAANVLVGGNLRACQRWFRCGLNSGNRHSGVGLHVVYNQEHGSPNQFSRFSQCQKLIISTSNNRVSNCLSYYRHIHFFDRSDITIFWYRRQGFPFIRDFELGISKTESRIPGRDFKIPNNRVKNRENPCF